MGGGWWGERLEGGHTQCMAGHLQLGERLCSLARPLAVRVPQPRLPLLPQPRLLAQEVAVVPMGTQVLLAGAGVNLGKERSPTPPAHHLRAIVFEEACRD